MKFINKEWALDAAERVVLTFLITFATAWLAAPSLDLNQAKALGFSALVAAVTLAKTILAGILTGGGSAVPATSTAAVQAKA